jgi:hypothetical protein
MNRPLSLALLLAMALGGCAKPADRGPDAAAPHVETTGEQLIASDPVTLSAGDADNRGATIAASGDHVVVTWAATTGTRTNIYAAVSRDGGRSFGAPARVNSRDGDARLSGEQPPRVAIGRDVAVAWQSRVDGRSVVRLARSRDGGMSFDPAVTTHDGLLSGSRGWASLALDPSGTAHVVWLDARKPGEDGVVSAAAPAAPTSGAADHVHSAHATTRQNVYHAAIAADGTRHEAMIAPDVCFCCKTGVAVGPDGAIFAVWRHIYPPNLRDMAVAKSVDGGKTFGAPVRLSEDGWAVDGCPEDGPSLSVDGGGVVHVTWPTIAPGMTNRKAIFYSYSIDGGRTFAPRVRLDDGLPDHRPAHPQLILSGNRVVVAWDEGAGDDRRIRARAVRSAAGDGWSPTTGPIMTVGDDRIGSYPTLANTSAGPVIAWAATAPTAAVRVARVQVP